MRSEFFSERSIAEIDLSVIKENYKIYKARTDVDRVIAVIKANAYGHGDVEVARALSEIGAEYFAVANINEGIRLRKNGISGDILILGYTPTSFTDLLREYKLEQTIVSEEHLSEIENRGKDGVSYHIALDLGMKRIGIHCDDLEKTVRKIKNAAKALKIKGIFTHFPSADSNDSASIELTERMISDFDTVCEGLDGIGIDCFHCQNSAAGLAYSSKYANTARLGITLYGYPPSGAVEIPAGIKPALTWKSLVCRVFTVTKGESIGYGRSFFADRDMRVATVTTGYADGYPRALSNVGKIIINGSRCPIVGRICMDMMMADVTDAPKVAAGDTAVLIGRSGDENITAEHIASCADTISYEILTGISSRVKRVYKQN